jgi:hypothetical protein
LAGRGFAQAVLQPADAVADDFQVGKQQLLAEAAEFIGQVAAAKAVEHHNQSAAVAQDAEPARVIAPLRRQQAGRVDKLHGGRRGFFWLELPGQPVEPFVGDAGDAALPLLTLGGVWLDAREPLKHGAFARPREACDANFHNP